MTEKRKTKGHEKKEAEELEELNAKLDELQKENQELLEKLQRVGADYANFQKRAPRQISEAVAFEKERIVKSLLPAMDNFEHTLNHAESAESVEGIVKGVKIIYDQMLDILKSHDAEQIDALGEKFDPTVHQAMLQRAEPDKEDGVVLEEYQKGYKLNGRVIRPSKVVVNKLPAEERPGEGENDEAFEGEVQ